MSINRVIRDLLLSKIFSTDIERMYGQRKPIAQRTPLFPHGTRGKSTSTPLPVDGSPSDMVDLLSTPATTEGETATESELETETETELEYENSHPRIKSLKKVQPTSGISSPSSFNSGVSLGARKQSSRVLMSQHDLLNKYFRRDVVILRNVDLFRYVLSYRRRHVLKSPLTFRDMYAGQMILCFFSQSHTPLHSPSYHASPTKLRSLSTTHMH